jgi:hypothetical protein
MNYLTAWREGHEAGMQLSLKIINELTGQEFQKSSDVVLYIKQLEGDTEYSFEKQVEQPKQAPKTDELSTKEERFIDQLAEKIAMKNWMWNLYDFLHTH